MPQPKHTQLIFPLLYPLYLSRLPFILLGSRQKSVRAPFHYMENGMIFRVGQS